MLIGVLACLNTVHTWNLYQFGWRPLRKAPHCPWIAERRATSWVPAFAGMTGPAVTVQESCTPTKLIQDHTLACPWQT